MVEVVELTVYAQSYISRFYEWETILYLLYYLVDKWVDYSSNGLKEKSICHTLNTPFPGSTA